MITKLLRILRHFNGRRSLPAFAIAVLACGIVMYNISGLEIGRDEGVHAFAAKTLAFEGHYALKDGLRYLDFDRRIAVGPTVIAPTALLFKLFGVSLYTIRAIPALYFLLFILAFYFLVKREFSKTTAFLTCLLILSSQWPFWRDTALFNPIYRTLTGESAGLFFLTLSLLLWKRGWVSAFVLGLAILTKYQFALALIPFLLVRSGFLTRRVGNSRTIVGVLFLIVIFSAPLFLWFAYQYFNLGQQEFLNQLGTYQNFSNQIFDLSFIRIKQNIIDKWMELNPTALKLFFTLPAIIYGWVYILKNKFNKDEIKLFMILFPTIWMIWYIFSRGYIRYEIPGLYFSLIFLAFFFVQNGFQTRRVEETLTLRVFLITLLLSILFYGFYINYREAKIIEPKNSFEMAKYIERNISIDRKIITSELDYDIGLYLDGRNIFHTPSGTRDKASDFTYYLIPSDMSYIISKKNDPTFEREIKNPIWQFVYKAGDWYLYEKR